ncbi:hypothetical protein EAE96_009652 [Botrytis aclada]|nr:hypothetical protein EAE96_009652 [Botrytis aclada]
MPSAAKHSQGQPTENAPKKSERQKVMVVKRCLRNSRRREGQRVAKVAARDEQTGSSSGSHLRTISGSKEPDAKSSAS